MRDACHADASFLQHRDVYMAPDFEGSGLTDDGYAAAIHAIYWKGDFISCMRITGDTISKLLAQSDVLKASESNEVVTDLERGRDLAKLGIEKDAITDAWNINGEILNPAKLYSVAITDFLSAGDTGYSMLQNAEPAPPSLFKDSTRLHRLSAAILFVWAPHPIPRPRQASISTPPPSHRPTFPAV